jgi:hypothetical protein
MDFVMDATEVDRLCEALRECIDCGPGVNLIVLPRARNIVAALRSAGLGQYANGKLVDIEAGLKRWFSARRWHKGRDGQATRHELYADISVFQRCAKQSEDDD